jgi:hypothetical protein
LSLWCVFQAEEISKSCALINTLFKSKINVIFVGGNREGLFTNSPSLYFFSFYPRNISGTEDKQVHVQNQQLIHSEDSVQTLKSYNKVHWQIHTPVEKDEQVHVENQQLIRFGQT